MFSSRSLLLSLGWLVASSQAITFTAPAANAIIDPTQEFRVSWTSVPTDPQTITLDLTCPPDQICILLYQELASGVRTLDGSVIIPGNKTFARGRWVVRARSSEGAELATGPEFVFTATDGGIILPGPNDTASSSEVETATDGGVTLPGPSDTASTTLPGTVTPSITPGPTTTPTSTSSPTGPSTSSLNAQPRIGGDGSGLFLSVAGIVAGFAALIA